MMIPFHYFFFFSNIQLRILGIQKATNKKQNNNSRKMEGDLIERLHKERSSDEETNGEHENG